jgi:AGCS family alanine or glycine:cation symporter
MLEQINAIFGYLVGFLEPILFFQIGGFPLIVLVLLFGSLTFTLYFKFINIKGFRHSIDIIKGKYDNPRDTGQISHFQALTSALSATIGLGNIAGVAVAVSLGGPGAVFWMIIIAFFSMTAKFVSATLGQLYRKINTDGSISGGPMYYLNYGLKERGFGTLGKVLAAIYAIFIIGGAFGGGNMFQANQSYELFGKLIGIPNYLYGIILAFLVGIVIIGGIKRIGETTEKIVPLMVVLYMGASLFIILTNIDKLGTVISSIYNQAFSPHAAYGAFIGVLVTGIKRAVFSNEGGVGSASIAHSAAKTDEPVREGIVAMIGPFIDTILVCFMTASVILITADKNPLDVSNVKIYISENIKNNGRLIERLENDERNEISWQDDWKIYKIDEYSNEFDENAGKFKKDTISKITAVKVTQLLKKEKYSLDEFNQKFDKNEQSKLKEAYGYHTENWLNHKGGSIHLNYLLKTEYNMDDKKFTDNVQGAELTSAAFGTTISWFPYVLSIVVFLFSFSTMISWYYYGDKGWKYLFGGSSIKIYQAMYLGAILLGSVASLGNVIGFSDMMILSCAFPNIIGCMFLLPVLKEKLNEYWSKYTNGEFKVYK